MRNTPKSFEDFYYSSEGIICSVKRVEDYAKLNDGEYNIFKDRMFCPECKSARLNFINKSAKHCAHLKKLPKSNHEEGCSYNYEYAPKTTVKKYIDSLNDYEVQYKVNSMLNLLFGTGNNENNIDNNEERVVSNNTNPMIIKEQNREKIVLRTFRRKRLDTWIDESHGKDMYVFYGKVKLKVVEKKKENYSYYLLELYTMNKNKEWKYRTRLYRGSRKDDVDENAIYNIVIIGNLEFNNKYWTIKLVNKDAIKFREI